MGKSSWNVMEAKCMPQLYPCLMFIIVLKDISFDFLVRAIFIKKGLIITNFLSSCKDATVKQ